MPDRHNPKENHLLALPREEYAVPFCPSGMGFRWRSATLFTNPGASCATPFSPRTCYHIAAVCHGEWRVSRNRRNRQRGASRRRSFNGGGGTPCPIGPSVQSAGHAYRVRGSTNKRQEFDDRRAWQFSTPLVAALYPGADDPDGADGGL